MKWLKILILIIVIVLLVGAFWTIYSLSNNFTTEIKTFYLVIDGKMITQDTTNVSIMEKTIEIHTVGELITGQREFTYKIVRNSSVGTFAFNIDGQYHSFDEIDDYTEGFEVELSDNSLIVKAAGINEVLQRMYGDGKLELPDRDYALPYFTLVVELADGSKSISVSFLPYLHVKDLQFDKTHMEF